MVVLILNKDKIIEMLESLKSGLISQATGGSFDEKEYKKLREIIISEPNLKELVPTFLKVNRTPYEFFRYMQSKFRKYAERRDFISDEINNIILKIEETNSLDPFDSIKEFEGMALIGSGGFGTVYKTYNEYFDMSFAVKLYNPIFISNELQKEGENRFFREAKMMFNLNSKYVTRIYDSGRYHGKPFIKMEYIEGCSLYDFCAKYGRLSYKKSFKVIKDILNGLVEAHSHQIIHRDLKPSNIMYDENKKYLK